MWCILSLLATTDARPTLELQMWRVIPAVEERDVAVGTPMAARYEPAIEVAPGDTIEWRLIASFAPDGAGARDLVLDLPLPSTVTLLLESVFVARYDEERLEPSDGDGLQHALLFSADGGQVFASAPLTRVRVEERDGGPVEVLEEIAASEYTHVRAHLTGSLAAGESVVLVVRTLVR